MRWTVVWKDSAQRDLAEFWLNAPDRERIQLAADTIDRTLANDADRQGEDFDGLRILVERPLAIVFTLRPDDRIATVIEVRRSHLPA